MKYPFTYINININIEYIYFENIKAFEILLNNTYVKLFQF